MLSDTIAALRAINTTEKYLDPFKKNCATIVEIYEEILMQTLGILKNMQTPQIKHSTEAMQDETNTIRLQELNTCADNAKEVHKRAESLKELLSSLVNARHKDQFVQENTPEIEKITRELEILSLVCTNREDDDILMINYDSYQGIGHNIHDVNYELSANTYNDEEERLLRIRFRFLELNKPLVRFLLIVKINSKSINCI